MDLLQNLLTRPEEEVGDMTPEIVTTISVCEKCVPNVFFYAFVM